MSGSVQYTKTAQGHRVVFATMYYYRMAMGYVVGLIKTIWYIY